ncbi:uncharacterized protein LOC122374191 [Amphibalanus amphitrite]|uniref:uncharacterized protein LOC122374191 n=1 Tax=Amphibalanus amphitrite TaxID=1232801 RepID=UPI001C91DED5|nr:uncharacterized protein LOC122374191 [Amphibalanus amphitrite]
MTTPAVSTHAREALLVLVIMACLASTGVIDSQWWLPPRADDPALVAHVADQLIPPSQEPYNLQYPNRQLFGQTHQVRFIQAITKNKTGGFFIETGAYDGELMSNSLELERSLGWRGLLIEPARGLFATMMTKHRRSWALQACCSQTGAPFQAMFRDQVKYGIASVEDGFSAQKVSNNIKKHLHPNEAIVRYPVDCYPLYTILLAMNITTVDFFSLDVEGQEMGVLAYLPWDKLNIKLVLVEFHMGHFWNPHTDQIRWFMEQQGYLAFHLTQDWLFVKRDCEFAQEADTILRRVKQELAGVIPEPGDYLHQAFSPFND